MNVLAVPLVLAAVALILLAAAPDRLANAAVGRWRRLVTAVAGVQFCIAAIMAVALISGWIPSVQATLLSFSEELPLAVSVRYDGTAALMFALVTFIGWLVCRYSIRYLDGEAGQGRYFRWISLTIGSVSLMVISGNLLMFVAAWMLTGLALHQLLLHYSDRPAARRAAWSNFIVSRIGDATLLVAMLLIYSEFGTLDFDDLFAAAGSLAGRASAAMQAAAVLLVIGAATKSAQFPFHTWLPQTMETPTPVSALMHAGIVNAGGYLIIRTSPLVSLAPWALTVLAILGALTACLAAAAMLTQTSVKRSLGYSTVAQMGFMMLQCGLGAFSAAMLHILAHSLYKSHAFLSSGTVAFSNGAAVSRRAVLPPVHWSKLMGIALGLLSLLGAFFAVFGLGVASKPGGILLGGLLCLALAHWIGQAIRAGNSMLTAWSAMIAAVLCFFYAASFAAVDRIMAASLPWQPEPQMVWIAAASVLAGFGLLVLISRSIAVTDQPRWLTALYVHASNGFYFENTLRHIFGRSLSS